MAKKVKKEMKKAMPKAAKPSKPMVAKKKMYKGGKAC
jgi:hypothetical protein